MCTHDTVYFYGERQKVLLTKRLNTEGLVSKALNQLYNNAKVSKAVNKKLFIRTYEPLKEAVNEGFGKITTAVEFGTPNYEFLKQLQYNAATFAAFKNHANIKEMVEALKDEQGNRRTKEEFIKRALEVDDKYNVRHLSNEYDAAVRQARSAAQWQKAKETAHLYPNIKFMPSVSANKREEHIQYYGMIRPIDDPFWDNGLPPLDWGCKCGWEVTDEETTDIPDNLPAPSPDFAFNPGKTAEVFKLDESGYYDGMTAAERTKYIKEAKAYVDWNMAVDQTYIKVYDSKKGNTDVYAHPVAMTHTPDFQTNLNHARQLANEKKFGIGKIEILPEINAQKGEAPANVMAARKTLLKDAPGFWNPDYRFDGQYFELKELNKKGFNPGRTIADKISDAKKQAGNAVLSIPEWVDKEVLYRQINSKLNKHDYAGFVLYLKYGPDWRYYNQNTWRAFFKKWLKKQKPT